MDQVRIRANVSAHGMVKGAETPDPIAATPLIEGAIANGVFTELERISPQAPSDPDDDTARQLDDLSEPEDSMHASVDPDDEKPVFEDHELPDPEDTPKSRRG